MYLHVYLSHVCMFNVYGLAVYPPPIMYLSVIYCSHLFHDYVNFIWHNKCPCIHFCMCALHFIYIHSFEWQINIYIYIVTSILYHYILWQPYYIIIYYDSHIISLYIMTAILYHYILWQPYYIIIYYDSHIISLYIMTAILYHYKLWQSYYITIYYDSHIISLYIITAILCHYIL